MPSRATSSSSAPIARWLASYGAAADDRRTPRSSSCAAGISRAMRGARSTRPTTRWPRRSRDAPDAAASTEQTHGRFSVVERGELSAVQLDANLLVVGDTPACSTLLGVADGQRPALATRTRWCPGSTRASGSGIGPHVRGDHPGG